MVCHKGCIGCKYHLSEDIPLEGYEQKNYDLKSFMSIKKYVPTRTVHRCSKFGYEHMNSTFRSEWHKCFEPFISDKPHMSDEEFKRFIDCNGFNKR